MKKINEAEMDTMLLEELKDSLIKFFSSTDYSKEEKLSKYISPQVIEDVLEKLGFVLNNCDTNGWEGDCWITYTLDNLYICVFSQRHDASKVISFGEWTDEDCETTKQKVVNKLETGGY